MKSSQNHVTLVTLTGTPFFCKYPCFRNAVAEDAALWLVRQPTIPMNSDKTRGFLVDMNGLIYDYARDTYIKGCPELRISYRLPFSFAGAPGDNWDAPASVKNELSGILDEVFAYWLSGSGPKGKFLVENQWAQQLCKKLIDFVKSHEECKYWKVLMPIFKP